MKRAILILMIPILNSCIVCKSTSDLPKAIIKQIPDKAYLVCLEPVNDALFNTVFEDLAVNISESGYIIEMESEKRTALYTLGKLLTVRPLILNGKKALCLNKNKVNQYGATQFDTYYSYSKLTQTPCLNDGFLDVVKLTMNFDTTLVKRFYK